MANWLCPPEQGSYWNIDIPHMCKRLIILANNKCSLTVIWINVWAKVEKWYVWQDRTHLWDINWKLQKINVYFMLSLPGLVFLCLLRLWNNLRKCFLPFGHVRYICIWNDELVNTIIVNWNSESPNLKLPLVVTGDNLHLTPPPLRTNVNKLNSQWLGMY